MSEHHDEPITIKTIAEVAAFYRNQIPVNIPADYAVIPALLTVADEHGVRGGVAAFRDFLYLLCDRLISDGHLYAASPKNPKNIADYPFLHNLTNMLAEIGYCGAPTDGGSLVVKKMPSCTASTGANGKTIKPKIGASGQIECLRFLSLCGFYFSGVDLEQKTPKARETLSFTVSYPGDPAVLTGLRVLSFAEMELRTGSRYWNDNNILRCDYRPIRADEPDALEYLEDFLQPLPERLREFAVRLHRRYIGMGMTCAMHARGDVNFAYAYAKNGRTDLSPKDIYTKSVWQFSYSLRHGYCLVVRAKKTDKYRNIVEGFPAALRQKIERGYGCDRKLYNERCQHGCQGIRLPLDESISELGEHIETWLDNEVSYAIKT